VVSKAERAPRVDGREKRSLSLIVRAGAKGRERTAVTLAGSRKVEHGDFQQV
jgi:hypothetical protein